MTRSNGTNGTNDTNYTINQNNIICRLPLSEACNTNEMSDFKLKGHLAMLGANVMWGLMAPVVKLVLVSGVVAPLLLVDFRMAGRLSFFG